MQSIERGEFSGFGAIEQIRVVLVAKPHVLEVRECVPASCFAGLVADLWATSVLPYGGDGLGRERNSPQGRGEIRRAQPAEKLRKERVEDAEKQHHQQDESPAPMLGF